MMEEKTGPVPTGHLGSGQYLVRTVTPAHRAIPFPIDAVKQRLLSIGVFDTDSKVVLEYKINNYYDENEGEDDSPVNAYNIHQAEADNHLTVKDSCWDQ